MTPFSVLMTPVKLVLVFFLTLFIFTGCGSDNPSREAAGTFPDFSFTTLDGETVSLSDYTGEKVVIIDIWATWCPPCVKGMPGLQVLYDEFPDQLEVFAASIDPPNDTSKVRNFVAQNNLTFKVTHDVTNEFPRRFPPASRGIPYLAIIDKNGVKVKEFTGYPADFRDQVIAIINKD